MLLAVTYRLWLPQQVFPQVPWLSPLAHLPAWVDAGAVAGLVLGLLRLLLGIGSTRSLRRWMFFTWVALTLLLLGDQQRLQPWAYQWWLLLILLSGAECERGLMWCRWLVISLYVFSGISKLDYVFLHHLGQQLVAASTTPLRFDPTLWPSPWPVISAGCLPVGELLIALGLMIGEAFGRANPDSRRSWWLGRIKTVAAVGAMAMHLLLMLVLGPAGLAHAWGVVVWNGLFVVLVALLFLEAARPLVIAQTREPHDRAVPTPATPRWSWISEAVAVVAILLPLGGIWGLVDEWPAWGLYSPRASMVAVLVPATEVRRFPESLRSLMPENSPEPWVQVPLDRWALQTLQTPLYPAARSQLGVARGVLHACGLADRSQVIVLGLANRWAGTRERHDYHGAGGLVEADQRFFWNTQPQPNLRTSPNWR